MAQIPSVDTIREKLLTNDAWLARALVALTARQTADEVRSETTRYCNGQGFMQGHAKYGTSMARFYQQRGYLTAKQLAWWRKKTPSGRARIEIYAAQLHDVAKHQAALKQQTGGQ